MSDASPFLAPGSRRPAAERVGVAPWTRRTGAKALVWSGDDVLLIEERRRDGTTFWTLPGGGIAPSESLLAGLRRELAEELGCRLGDVTPVGTCRYRHTSSPALVTHYWLFRAEMLGSPACNPAEGIVALDWVHPEALPDRTLEPFGQVIRMAHATR